MNILSIECSNEFLSCKRDVFESYLIQYPFYTQTIQLCPRQWGYVCNSGGVLIEIESYQNDRSNSCHRINILSIGYSHEFQGCRIDVFESCDYSLALNAQTFQVCLRQWGYVCNSGGVLFGSESYQNDRFNSCHSMNIISIE